MVYWLFIKKLIKKILPNILLDKIQIIRLQRKQRILQNIFNTNFDKYCLLVYITSPFIQGVDDTHQNKWQVVEFAKILSRFGYNIDVIDYNYCKTEFPNSYDLLIDIYPVGNRPFVNSLKDDCIEIAYMTGSDHEFSVSEEKKRIERVKDSRGVDLPVERIAVPISRDIEKMSAMFFIGNSYNLRSYKKFRLPPVYLIPNTGYKLAYDGSSRNKRAFLFFASFGQIHKGLDLCLEAFAYHCSDLELYICSSFADEEEFCQAYHHELYECSNIHPIGFVDIAGKQFRDIYNYCCYCIMPSCSEGIAGSILTAMSVGIIPVVTPECGLDDGEYIPIQSATVEGVVDVIRECSQRDSAWIKNKSDEVRSIIEKKYSKDNYSKVITKSLRKVLKIKG